jgi:hypothetical protein
VLGEHGVDEGVAERAGSAGDEDIEAVESHGAKR